MFSAYSTKKIFGSRKKNICFPINYDFKNRPMRQKNKRYVCENGAFYIFKKKGFMKYKKIECLVKLVILNFQNIDQLKLIILMI